MALSHDGDELLRQPRGRADDRSRPAPAPRSSRSTSTAAASSARRAPIRLRAAGHAIGDLTALDDCRLLIIERDNAQGPAAAVKRIDRLDLCAPSRDDGFLPRTPVVDLLDIADPTGISLPPRPATSASATRSSSRSRRSRTSCRSAATACSCSTTTTFPSAPGATRAGPTTTRRSVIDVPGLRDGRRAAGRLDRRRPGHRPQRLPRQPRPAARPDPACRAARASTPAASSTSPRTSTACARRTRATRSSPRPATSSARARCCRRCFTTSRRSRR